MPPTYHYPGRRDPEQEAEDKRRTRTSNRDAMEAAARAERAAFLAHIRGTPGELSVRNMMPSWDTYKNSPEMSGNTAMTDYISRYNAKNPQRAFKPEVYTPQARQAAPAVAPAAPQSRVMQNAPAVGVQAGAPLAPQSKTAAEMEKRTSGGMEDALNAQGAVQDIAKKNLTPDQMNERASAVQQPGPLDTLRDDTAARQRVLNRDFSGPKPDGRPDVVYGWAGYGGTGRQLVSVPRDERNGQAHSDARREFYRKHEQDRADAYAGTMQRGQKPSVEGLRAWNKANPFNSDMYERDARAYADAAVAPRPVAFNAPPTALNQAQARAAGAPVDAYNAQRMPDGSLAYARPEGSPTLTAGRSASVTMPNGKVERRAFSATPTTDAVTNAGLGLDALMPGAGLAMTAGAMGAGAMNTRGGSMIAQAMTPDEIAKRNGDELAAKFKFNPSAPLPTRPTEEQNQDFNSRGGTPLPPGSNTADPNSVASQAKAATSSVANTPMPITSAVKQAATGAAGDLAFAGLDPNLSEDEKAKKRGEMLAAKYKPQL